MRKFFTLSLAAVSISLAFLFSNTASAQYTPIPVTGFNHDVIAEGTGTSTLSTTTREMDAITPSNFVMCSRQFATANNVTPANSFGLADNGNLSSGNKIFQLAPYTGSNALYLFPTDSGKLKLTTPARYTGISMLVLSTEGNANVNVTFKFTDGTTQAFTNRTFYDWFSTTTTGLFIQGFGRIKRKAGPFTAADYEGGNAINPHMYSIEFALPCSKTLDSIIFRNTSATTQTASNRAFVFAISGLAGSVPPTPVINPVTLCNSGTTTLAITNPQAGVNYTWYGAAAGGFAAGTGSSFTTPNLTTTTSYYVTATNALTGCATDPRVQVTVTVSASPAAPAATATSVCPGSTSTLTITSPQTGITYRWYTTATGGTPVGTGNTYTTPVITASTTYYAEAVSAAGCVSTRTAVPVTFLPKLPSPVAQAGTIGATFITYNWAAVAGATGYQVSVNTGAFQNPSSGLTGLTHTANGLTPLSNVVFRLYAVGPQVCQNSDTITVTARTLTDEIYIPNAFTPNGDGRNDVFRAYGNVITGAEIKIFNQWGEAIFESNDFNVGWDGTYKSKQQPVGVYVYVMKLRLTDGRELLRKGSVNLVR